MLSEIPGEGMAAERATGRYIAVEGPIGVGKTALARRLASEVLERHLRKRQRDYERAITPEYLGRLTEAFRNFFHHYTEAPLLVVDCSDIDFVEHGGELADLIKEIRGMRQGVQHYIPLGSR